MSIGGRQVISGDEFRRLSTSYQRRSQEVVDLTAALTSEINSAIWESVAATSFRSDWTSKYGPTLRNLSDILAELSRELTQRAQVADQIGSR